VGRLTTRGARSRLDDDAGGEAPAGPRRTSAVFG
jgi:hypothetical protein